MVGVSPDHTSVPRWPAAPNGVDPNGVSYLVVAAGPAGAEVAARWIDEIHRAGKPVWSHHEGAPGGPSGVDPGAACSAALAEELGHARVGVRVMVAGPELVVLDCLRAARDAGALEAELTAHVTDSATKRIYCSHCRTCTEAEVAVAATLSCAGCGRKLVVYHHVSRRHGAYLGFMADAEAPPA